MATSFPSNPVVGQSVTLAGSNFVWNGTAWLRITSSVSLNAVNMDALLDVNVSSPPPTVGQVLAWSGTEWKAQNQVATSVVAPKDARYVVVSTLGNDTTGDGSWGNPFQTIGHAIQTVGNFGTVLVCSGNYDIGTYTINNYGINIIGVSDKTRPQITGQFRDTIGFGGWSFTNLWLINSGQTDGSFYTSYDSASFNRPFTFRNCMFAGTANTRGLFLKGSSGGTFINCEFFTNINLMGGTTNPTTWKFLDSIGTVNFRTDVTTGASSRVIIDGADELVVRDHTTGHLIIRNVAFISNFVSGWYFGTGQGSLIIENSSFIDKVTDANGYLDKQGTQNYELYNVILPTTITNLAGTNTSRNVENTMLLSQLSNVSNTAPTVGQSLKWNGTEWAPSA